MKSLHVLRTLNPDFGGPVAGTAAIAQELARLGHSTHVATLDAPGSHWEQHFPVSVSALGPAYGSYGYTPRFERWIRQAAPEYDAIIVNGVWLYPSVGVWRGLRKTKTPYFLYTHGALHPWFARAYPGKHLKKTVYWKLWEHRTLRDARAVLFTSAEEHALAKQSFAPFECRPSIVSYCASAPPSHAAELATRFVRLYPELQGRRIVLFLGRIHLVKGCDLLLKAFARLAPRSPEMHLVMAGSGSSSLVAELKTLAQSLGIERRITWTGALQNEEKWGALHSADLFISCSHCENFGVAAVEALACGVPIAITNQVNIWREIRNAHAGFVAQDSLGGATELLEQWLACSAGKWQCFRESALRCYQENYHVKKCVQRLLENFKNSGVAV